MIGYAATLALRGAGNVPAGVPIIAPRPAERFAPGGAGTFGMTSGPEVDVRKETDASVEASPVGNVAPARVEPHAGLRAVSDGLARPTDSVVPVTRHPAHVDPFEAPHAKPAAVSNDAGITARSDDVERSAPPRVEEHTDGRTSVPAATDRSPDVTIEHVPDVQRPTVLPSTDVNRTAAIASEAEIVAPEAAHIDRQDSPRPASETPARPSLASPRQAPPVTVTIGRIDVVVDPAPAAPTRRSPERTRGFAGYARARRGHVR